MNYDPALDHNTERARLFREITAKNPLPVRDPASPLHGNLWGERMALLRTMANCTPRSVVRGAYTRGISNRELQRTYQANAKDACRKLYDAMREAVLAERRACQALVAKRAPKSAALIDTRPALPEWSEK